jgi:hypothetical protein
MKDLRHRTLVILGVAGFLVAFLPTPWFIVLGERGMLNSDKANIFMLVATLSFISGLPLLLIFGMLLPRKVWKKVALSSVITIAYLLQVAIIGFLGLMMGIGQAHAMGR